MQKKKNKLSDIIIMMILIVLVIIMVVFTISLESSNSKIISMEIYKSFDNNAGKTHYYIHENSNNIEIRNLDSDGFNKTHSKEINPDLINNFQKALEEYVNKKITLKASFFSNERYTIEYNGGTVTVPNPTIVSQLGYDSSPYSFYYTVDNFINNISN